MAIFPPFALRFDEHNAQFYSLKHFDFKYESPRVPTVLIIFPLTSDA